MRMNINSSRILLAALSIVLCAALAVAQATTAITGRITDPQGAGVPGAIVTLYARERSVRITTMTDTTGEYHIEKLAPGEYLMEADAMGFAPVVAQRLRVEQGQTATLNVPLELAGVRAEVVVTASDTAQTVDEVSKAITVLRRREMDERAEYSISEALRTVPGLRVQQLGGPGAFVSIKTRGLRNQDTAVLIDGLRFRDPTASQGDASGYLSDLNVTGTSRIEVLRGSGSSLYGTNAIGGVVNIVTDEGGGPFHGNLLAEGGGLGLFRGRAQVAGGASDDRILYSAAVSHLNVSRGVDRDDAARNTSGQGRVSFRLTPTATLSGRIYSADSFLQLNGSPQAIGTLPPSGIVKAQPLSLAELRRYEAGAPQNQLSAGAATFIPSVNDPDNSRATRFFSGAVIFAQRPTEKFGYSVSYHRLRTDGQFRNGPGGVSFQPKGTTRSDFDGRIQTLNARSDFQIGRTNFITAGYEFENEKYINRSFQVNPADNSTVDVTQRSHTLFVQDQLRLLDDRLQLSAAFRAQFFSLSRPQFTPVASAPYQNLTFEAPPNAYTGDGSIAYLFRESGTKVRAHVGNGYRAPSLYERFGTFFSSFFGYSVYGDPRLRPERSLAFDAGVDQTLYNNRLRASATYFYTRLQDEIAFNFSGAIPQPDPFGRFGGYLNTKGGLARGVELSVAAAPTRSLDLNAAYTYTNSDQRRPLVDNVIRSFATPDHQFSFVATQRFGRRIFVNFDLTATSDYLAPIFDSRSFSSRVYSFDGLIKADFGASYTLPLSEARSLRFFGNVENLLNREYYESGFRTPGRTGRAGAIFNF